MSLGESTTGETTTAVINLTKSQSQKSACLYSPERVIDVRGSDKTKKEPRSFKLVVSFFCLVLVNVLCQSRRSTQGPSHLTPSLLIQCKTGGKLSEMQLENLLKFTWLEERPLFPGTAFFHINGA